MFWKFTLNNSHIDTLLDSEDGVSLQEIMDEEDVLQECKGQNKKLLDFLMTNNIMEEMIDLIITEPEEDSDERSRFKYPNLACELLTCDLTIMNERLAKDESLLNKVYSFLEKEAPLNPLLASFFSKVMGLLISRQSEEVVEFIKKKENFVALIINHLGTSAVMDLLLRLITCIESSEIRLAVIKWLNDEQLLEKLIALISPAVPEDKHFNVSQLLCDIIRASREQLSQFEETSDTDPLLDTIEDPKTVTHLLSHFLDNDKFDGAAIVNGLSVLQTLLEFRKSVPFGMDPDQVPLTDNEHHQESVRKIIGAIVPYLKVLHQILLNPPTQFYSQMSTTIGTLSPPLGNCRLQICRLATTIVENNILEANKQLAELGTMEVILNLYHQYPWNNFLHTQVTHCISSILTNEPCKDESGSQDYTLLNQLFNEVKLIEKILEWWEENEKIQTESGHRRGYMGHLTKTANDVVNALQKGPTVDHLKELLAARPKEVQDQWETFVSVQLADVNKKNVIDLVGPHPLQSSSEDDDADFRGIPFPSEAHLQQAFADYQLQQMTSTFIDQFGFSEEEFGDQQEDVTSPFNRKIDFSINTDEEPPNAALFERACNERIQQFDDPDSDEDIWEERNLTMTAAETSPQPLQRHAGQSDEDSSSDEDLDSPAVIRQTPTTDDSKPPPVPTLVPAEGMDVDAETWVNEEPAPMAMDTTPVAWAAPEEDKSENWAAFSPPATDNSSSGWANFEGGANDGDSWANFTEFSAMESVPEPASRMDVGEPSPARLAPYAVSDDMDVNTNGAVHQSSPPVIEANHAGENDLDLEENFSFLSQRGLLKQPQTDQAKSPKPDPPSDPSNSEV